MVIYNDDYDGDDLGDDDDELSDNGDGWFNHVFFVFLNGNLSKRNPK